MQTLELNTSFAWLKKDYVFLHTQLDANPLTRHLLPELEPILPKMQTLERTEEGLWFETLRTKSHMTSADNHLDRQARSLHRLFLNDVDGDRNHPTLLRFFGKKSPWLFTKPVLGDQLKAMAGWPASLRDFEAPSITALAKQIEETVQWAKSAIADNAKAEQKLKDFRLVGLRKAFIDEYNAIRKRIHGLLREMVDARPELNLPSDFAEQFFLKRRRTKTKTMTLEEELASLYEDRDAILARIVELEKEQERRDKEAAEAEAVAKEIAEMEAQQKALSERINKLKGGKPSA